MISRITAPWPFLRPVHQPRPHRIQVDVPAHFPIVTFVLDGVGLVATLEEMSAGPVAPVVVAYIAAVEVLHAGRQVGLRRFHVQVIVIIHHHKGVEMPAIRLHGPSQPIKRTSAIRVILDDPAPLVAARHHLVPGALKLDSQGPGHATKRTSSDPPQQPLVTKCALTPDAPTLSDAAPVESGRLSR